MQVGASVRVPRRLGGIFGTGEPVQETLRRELLARPAVVTDGTSRIASDFGLQLNLAPGKAEAVVRWVDPGSRPVRRGLMSLSSNRQIAMLLVRTRLGDGGELQIPALSENERAKRIVQAYRHLGTVAQAGAGMGREIASRANAGQAATHELSRRLLGNEELPRQMRGHVAKACVASRCLHQASTWDALEGPHAAF